MFNKVILVVCDGLADRPIEAFKGLTPLEAANTPNLDRLATLSECGVMCALGRGYRPGSDTSHLAILGYDPKTYYSGRGPIEVAGLGIQLREGDIAFRGNFGTVDEQWNIVDRRAGRIREVQELTESLDGLEIDGVTFIVKPGTAHRAGVVLRGESLSDAISDCDPHEAGLPVREVMPTDDTPEAKRTAKVLNAFLRRAYETLRVQPLNAAREQEGKLAANFLLLRGPGKHRNTPSFKERYGLSACCIAGGGLYKGIGALLGMDVLEVPGATGLPDTDIRAKFERAKKELATYDFIFVHVKASDSLAEDGNALGKREFIEKLDAATDILLDLPSEVLVVVTADHSTSSELKQHTADPVPIAFCGKGVRVDNVVAYGERACAQGGMGFITGLDVMTQVENLLGKLHLVGA